ncbi:alpha/beta fold hydrolase [Rhodococcus artemisiae]|uniref:Alpha/beta hydrolase n=1 Tax=Rhodococcus artemisiae TaxID=714159 RepID=A0ABU7LFK3_9NOCA|nr:alpha/beta hydrolase [Rhodococcus artemisiae]MEE2060313.1 alpha/beta hydrolase [Rhodococcus artemisiae]
MVTGELAHGWAGTESGPVTLVLHGGGPGCHATSDFAAVMAHRPERRWLWVDLPGYGASAPESDADAPPLTTAAHALDCLLTDIGVRNIDVLAQSLGGSVALRLAAERPNVFRRIVAIGSQPAAAPAHRTGSTRDPGLGARARAAYYGGSGPNLDKMRQMIAELEWYETNLVPEPMVRARHSAATTPTARTTATANRTGEDLGDHLAAVMAPTLVLWGRHDPFAGPDYAAAFADALPRGDLAVICRTAHHPQSERPEMVAALAEAFFTDRS